MGKSNTRWIKTAILLIALFGLLTTSTYAKTLEDEELGKIIPPPSTDKNPTPSDEVDKAGDLPKDYEPVLPFTESQ